MKKPINEIARMQRIAGLITESEYQEAANVMDIAEQNHLEALKKELNLSNLDNWYISSTGNAYGIEITSTSKDQSQIFSTKHDNEGNVVDTNFYKNQPTSSNQKSLSITPAQKKEFLDRIKNIDSVNLEMDAANVLARVLTNDEAEFIEDVEEFGYNPDEVEQFAQDLINGVVNESSLNEGSFLITMPNQKKEFLKRIQQLTKMSTSNYAFEEAGNILARVLTDDEAESIEDVEEFGYNPDEVEQLAQKLINDSQDLNLQDLKNDLIASAEKDFPRNSFRSGHYVRQYLDPRDKNFEKLQNGIIKFGGKKGEITLKTPENSYFKNAEMTFEVNRDGRISYTVFAP